MKEMTEIEMLEQGQGKLSECIADINKMVSDLRNTSVRGPLLSALQHLEEAAFWLERCKEFNSIWLKTIKEE